MLRSDNLGYSAEQTCYRGRYGAEKGSDQFGGHVMIHTTDPTQHMTTTRVEYVEFVHVGQSFRLGRHPINFHLTGDLSGSYIRGCGIHQTYNRAINVRDSRNLLVERNVIYNVLGGAIFFEDGTETGNIFQYNLAIFTRSSSRLLSDDVTPAAFWITNPNNTIQHNTVAGGTHVGYWFNLDDSVTSAVTGIHYPRYTSIGAFTNNTAHSCGWYGLWINSIYTPRITYSSFLYSSTPQVAKIEHTMIWNCRKGIILSEMGAVQIHGLIGVNNVEAGFEGDLIVEGEQFSDHGPLIENSIIAGHVSSIPSQGCTHSGIVSPYKYGFMIRNISFANFDHPQCAALTITRIPKRCPRDCGGFIYKTANLTFTNVENRVHNEWIWESVYEDMDGSLCGYPSCTAVPCTGTLPPNCTVLTNSSTLPTCVCPADVRRFKFTFHWMYYNYPYGRSYYNIEFTNDYGTAVHPYRSRSIDLSSGWMTYLVSGQHYDWHLQYDSTSMANVSYYAYLYKMQVSLASLMRCN